LSGWRKNLIKQTYSNLINSVNLINSPDSYRVNLIN